MLPMPAGRFPNNPGACTIPSKGEPMLEKLKLRGPKLKFGWNPPFGAPLETCTKVKLNPGRGRDGGATGGEGAVDCNNRFSHTSEVSRKDASISFSDEDDDDVTSDDRALAS
jgi:hypothetical protein